MGSGVFKAFFTLLCPYENHSLSILWNFTLNRKYTFRSAANIPVAMAKIFGFYLIFTPASTVLGDMATGKGVNEYIVLALTMLSNFILEYLFCKFVVYRGKEDTLNKKQDIVHRNHVYRVLEDANVQKYMTWLAELAYEHQIPFRFPEDQ